MFYSDFYAAAWMGQEGGGNGWNYGQLADANSPTYKIE